MGSDTGKFHNGSSNSRARGTPTTAPTTATGKQHNNSNNSNNKNNYVSPLRGSRSPRNPYHHGNNGHSSMIAALVAKYPLQCLAAGVFLMFLTSTFNMARLSGNIAKAVETEMQDSSKVSVAQAVVKNLKKVGKALKEDDDKYVKLPKQVYEKHFKGDTAATASKGGNLKGSSNQERQLDQQNQIQDKQQDNQEPKGPFTKEESNLLAWEQKLLKGGYDYMKVHEDNWYYRQHEPPKELQEDQRNERWVEPERKHLQVEKHEKMMNDGHFMTEYDIGGYDPNDPYAIPPRKHKWNNRWESMGKLPVWMKDYFYWHDGIRSTMNYTNWRNEATGLPPDTHNGFLVATCRMDHHSYALCGNVAHRLRPVPALLRIAYKSKRLLLIYWQEGLEQLVEPPHTGGMNWLFPEYMMRALTKTNPMMSVEQVAKAAMDRSKLIISATINDPLFGEPYYNALVDDTQNEHPADVIFHNVYNVLFKPTFRLHERIQETHHTMGMPVGSYAAVHIDYDDHPTTPASKEVLRLKVENALNCVSNLRPGGPFLVAGQTYEIAKLAVKYARQHNVMVAARQVAHDNKEPPNDMFNSFIEIYFMANANCVAYGSNDAYGQLGYMMGYDHDCRLKYDGYESVTKQCVWTDTKAAAKEALDKFANAPDILDTSDINPAVGFAEPFEEQFYVVKDNGKAAGDDSDDIGVPEAKKALRFYKDSAIPRWLKNYVADNKLHIDRTHPTIKWMRSYTIPDWLKYYFMWHKEQMAHFTEDNWKEQRFLVMSCYSGQKCGNVGHRIRPLMGHLRVAANTKRILLIHWDKPNMLEYFVQPTKSDDGETVVGIDWRLPEYLLWKIRSSTQQVTMDTIEKQARQPERKVVNCMFNDDTFAEGYYNDRLSDNEYPADRVLHDVFHAFFQPTIMLQERINEMMDHVGLEYGNYAVAHVDYSIVPATDQEQKDMIEKVGKAMNCMSNLKPGGPFVVFAETFEAAGVATAYGLSKGVKVPSKQIAHDKHVIPKDVMGSWAEIFLMAGANCVAYGKGGFGQLGYILGEDYDCRVKYEGPAAQTCKWKGEGDAALVPEKIDVRKHVTPDEKAQAEADEAEAEELANAVPEEEAKEYEVPKVEEEEKPEVKPDDSELNYKPEGYVPPKENPDAAHELGEDDQVVKDESAKVNPVAAAVEPEDAKAARA